MSTRSMLLAICGALVLSTNAVAGLPGFGKFSSFGKKKEKKKENGITDDEILNAYIDVFKDKATALEFFSKALGAKDKMQERIAFIRTALDGGLKTDKGEMDGNKIAETMHVGVEVTEELLKIVKENKELDAKSKQIFKKGLAASRKSIGKEWMINLKIGKAWKDIVLGLAKSARGGGMRRMFGGARKAKRESDKMKKRKPIFRKLRQFSKKNRKLNKLFKTYSEKQGIKIEKKDSTDELPEMETIKGLDDEEDKVDNAKNNKQKQEKAEK